MKTTNLFIFSLLSLLLTACFGDKKSINVEEANDTSSFINNDFKVNLIDYDEKMSACSGMSKADLAKLYDVTADDIYWMDSSTNERMNTNIPTCNFRVMIGENEFNYLIGGIIVHRKIKKEEMMGEIAEAVGGGEIWKDAWALQKSISKSAEWIENVGLATIWKPKRRELHIKFDGYLLSTTCPGLNYEPNKKERNDNYKNTALAMA